MKFLNVDQVRIYKERRDYSDIMVSDDGADDTSHTQIADSGKWAQRDWIK